MLLSKSQYIRGLQCHKSLWLYKNKHHLRDEVDDETESLFNTGFTVGEYSKQLFPGGAEIEFTPDDFDCMVKKTADLIAQGVKTLYEATFKEKGFFAMADILHKTTKGWNIYEVKASTSTRDHQIDDASIQYYALSDVIDINKTHIVHINNQYERQGDLDIKALFTIDDITNEVAAKQKGIKKSLKSFESMIKGDMPDIDIGPHCSDPYGCDFTGYCWSQFPEPSVFNLYRMSSSKKFKMYDDGIIKYEDIPDDYALNKVQKLQVEALLNDHLTIDKGIIKKFIKTIKYPISFFDFETYQNAIPRFNGQRPYMQMPFQYSLHVLNKRGKLSHIEYLGDENQDPRRELAECMLNDLPKSGSIVAYYQSFEISRIKELANIFPDLSDDLMELVERFVDLIIPFRKLGYYHPDFNGSFSIKSVLPALFPDDPELDYKKLEIQNGGMAMDIFANLYLLKDQNKRDKIRADLLAYCRLDTLAMVRILEKLRCALKHTGSGLSMPHSS